MNRVPDDALLGLLVLAASVGAIWMAAGALRRGVRLGDPALRKPVEVGKGRGHLVAAASAHALLAVQEEEWLRKWLWIQSPQP